MRAGFERQYRAGFGFLMPGRALIIESITVEAIGASEHGAAVTHAFAERHGALAPLAVHPIYCDGGWREAPFYDRDDLRPGDGIDGPAVIREANATTVVEPGWRATLTPLNHLILRRAQPRARGHRSTPPSTRCGWSCSTICSWRSPSRWAWRWRAPPTRSTSRSGWISPARCSTAPRS